MVRIAVAALLIACSLVIAFWLWSDPVAAPLRDANAAANIPPAEVDAAKGQENLRDAVPGGAVEAAKTAAEVAAPRGKLRVLVRTETGAPVAAAIVLLSGELERTTDATGLVEFEAVTGRTLVRATPPAGTRLQPVEGRLRIDVDQTRESVIVLPELAATFWCRLVAAENGAPIAGARVEQSRGGRTDAQGLAEVTVGEQPGFGVTAEGRAPRVVAFVAGHETAATPLTVPMVRAAVLAVQALDAAQRPVAGATLLLSTHSHYLTWPESAVGGLPAREWSTPATDASGRSSLADLPPDVPLRVQLVPGPNRSPRPGETWVLTAGVNERQVVVAAESAITGRLLDADGQPLAGLALVARLEPMLNERATATAAADGSFRLAPLAAGRWQLTLADPSRWFLHQVVELAPGASRELELRLAACVAIAGRVVGPDGQGVAGVVINAEADDDWRGGATSGADGAFRIGALAAGRYLLTTEAYEDQLGLPAPVGAETGDEHVVLRVSHVFGSVAGVVLRDSLPCGDVWVTAQERNGDDAIGSRSDLDGSYRYDGLREGTWDLIAHDRRGNVGVQHAVQVRAGRTTDGMQIVLERGAMLRPVHAAADEFIVCRGEHAVARDNLPDGLPGEALVPPGAWTVRFLRDGRELTRREVTVTAGERRLVEGR